ncbi:hypothetical protein CJ195_15840 [Bacillus sp. UMB0899]|nr:hypothetical protein CJ195_15840 [Bacillus sp. UMB0899]
MYLPIIESMIFLFLVLEQYCIERVMEQKALEVLTFFDAVKELDTIVKSNEMPNNNQIVTQTFTASKSLDVKPVNEKAGRILSDIDEESNLMFEQLQQEISILETTPHEMSLEPIYDEMFSQESMDDLLNCGVTDDEYLTIQDLQKDSSHDVTIPYVTAKISDRLDGLQQWVVKVEDITNDQILVNDGQKLWLQIGENKAARIQVNDMLQLDVIRSNSDFAVDRIFKLEHTPTDEYIIPDEFYNFYNDAAM